MIFRDHLLSDLIGFVYSRMDAADAADDFLAAFATTAAAFSHSGRDALVPIILDGENAWEYYDRNGRPFLRELYRRISDDPQMTRGHRAARRLRRIEPDAAQRHLSRLLDQRQLRRVDRRRGRQSGVGAAARPAKRYDAARGVSPEKLRLAYEELLIAEGSDWNWWYGPEHDSANRVEFDQLYRSHLANVYRALGKRRRKSYRGPF